MAGVCARAGVAPEGSREPAIAAVRDLALEELAKVNLRSHLLVLKNRRAIGNAAYEVALTGARNV
jgi:hypothetical protein